MVYSCYLMRFSKQSIASLLMGFLSFQKRSSWPCNTLSTQPCDVFPLPRVWVENICYIKKNGHLRVCDVRNAGHQREGCAVLKLSERSISYIEKNKYWLLGVRKVSALITRHIMYLSCSFHTFTSPFKRQYLPHYHSESTVTTFEGYRDHNYCFCSIYTE